jgi:hypothetical protein
MSAPEVDQDERLRDQLGRLPREVMPERDLWPNIRSQLEPAASSRSRRWSERSLQWALAAGVAGLAVGVLATMAVLREHALPAAPQAGADGLMPVSVYAFAPPKAEAARLALRREVAANLSRLPGPTRVRVQRNLMVIEQALADIQVALRKNPRDPLLQELLMTTYQNEVDTLSNMVVLTRDAHSQVST